MINSTRTSSSNITDWGDKDIPAAKINGIIHRIKINRQRRVIMLCGLSVRIEDILTMLEKPEYITCQDCVRRAKGI